MKKLFLILTLIFLSALLFAQTYTEKDLAKVSYEIASLNLNEDIIINTEKVCNWFIKNSDNKEAVKSAKNIKLRCGIERDILNGAKSLSEINLKYLTKENVSAATNRISQKYPELTENIIDKSVSLYGKNKSLDGCILSMIFFNTENNVYEDTINMTNRIIKKHPELFTTSVKESLAYTYILNNDYENGDAIYNNLIKNSKDYKDIFRIYKLLIDAYLKDMKNFNDFDNKSKNLLTNINEVKKLGEKNNDQEIIDYAEKMSDQLNIYEKQYKNILGK